MSASKTTPERPKPPESLPADAVKVWNEIVESNDLAGNVDRAALEVFCTLVAQLREARDRVKAEGMVVEDARGRVVPHPALQVERALADQIRAWGDRFAPLVKPVRKRGYMADATATAIANAPHLRDEPRYAGAIAAAKTLAWLIDEAQRAGMDALQRAAFGTIPMYVKVCAELQITPASAPTEKATKKRQSKLSVLRGGGTGDGEGAATG
ncbi:phage terminase, small subunit, putative, P27 family [Cellulosimicrobium cellulans]|nr:phage terminase, small subunit, putative, P27 family [Cellulosimicrobium cellulans]